jgi:pyridoxal 5'-phosphate synthase pdxS subunit
LAEYSEAEEVSMSERNGNTGLRLKTGLAEMLKGGVIMDVTDAGQADIA